MSVLWKKKHGRSRDEHHQQHNYLAHSIWVVVVVAVVVVDSNIHWLVIGLTTVYIPRE